MLCKELIGDNFPDIFIKVLVLNEYEVNALSHLGTR